MKKTKGLSKKLARLQDMPLRTRLAYLLEHGHAEYDRKTDSLKMKPRMKKRMKKVTL